MRLVVALAVSLLVVSTAALAREGADDAPARPQVHAAAPAKPSPAQRALERARIEGRRHKRTVARRAQLARLSRSPTIRAALKRLVLLHGISPTEQQRLRHTLYAAQRAHSRLSGTRRAELGAVIAAAEALARTHTLTASRVPAVFLTLRRNREFWTQRALPSAGARFTFGRDPVVFQYYPGTGLALQPLASFGRASAMASLCLAADTRYRCRPRALRKLLDQMLALGVERGGFLAWEYYFRFAGGTPPWISAMTQSTGAQALARAGRALDVARYVRAARRALGALDVRPPVGVGIRTAAGRQFVMYSFDPGQRVLNGELQALIGVREAALLIHSSRAEHLYAQAEPEARRTVRSYDTGAWSLYSRGGEESTLGYHKLLTGFLGVLCRRTGRPEYCVTQRRFARYEHEPPRVRLHVPRRIRRGRPTTLRFTLSKISHVRVVIWGPRGVQARRDMRLPRGHHAVRWTPPYRGRVRLRIVSIGPGGTRGVVTRSLRVWGVHRHKPNHRKLKH
jgi:D-glucuronyl C5-epimerase C-terminus